MTMIIKKYGLKIFLAVSAAFTFCSCSDFFNPDSSDMLKESDYVGETTELYSGYFGLASLVQDVADQAVFLEGLRSDFLEPTLNAPQEMWDIYSYKADLQGNHLANPKGYYAIINSANDYLFHLKAYQKANPRALTEEVFAGLGGGAIRFKVWAYMMLAKIYGEAKLIDEPVTGLTDINRFQTIGFEQIITQCIYWMTTDDFGYQGIHSVRWSKSEAILIPGKTESASDLEWNRVTPHPNALLAELNLWAGNYGETVSQCIAILNEGALESSYMVTNSEWNSEWMKFGSQFTRKEHVNVAFFDYAYHQTNRIIKYFSNNYPNEYLLRPTEAAMARFNAQIRGDGQKGDLYRGEGRTFKKVNGEYVVQKFLSGHETSTTIFRNDVLISLYRASDIFLFLAEALNNLGRFEEAYVFLNGGIGNYFDSNKGVFIGPFANKGYPTALYDPKSPTLGVRGRVSMGIIGSLDQEKLTTGADSLRFIAKMDSVYVEETILESAGESRGLFAMIRNARKYPEMQAVWARKVAAKYSDGGAGIESKLVADIDNWFIKYNLSE